MSERDFPVGHPAAADYKGEKYTPETAPYGSDFPRNHPARGGRNTSALDTPDGMRAAHNAWEKQRAIEQASADHGGSDLAADLRERLKAEGLI